MNVMILDTTDDVEMLREIGNEWAALAHGAKFGLPLDVNIWLDTMRRLVMQGNGDVLVLMDGETVKGSMGLSYGLNHVGPGKIANECTFFVSPSARGGGLRMIPVAEKLAASKGCNFVFMNASNIAGDADRSGKLYGHCGYRPFESSHMKVL
jgi:GNAT superfamily N-acetyltransferase